MRTITLRRSLVALFAAAISFGAITQAQAETLRIGYQKYGTLVLLKAKGSLEKRLAEQGIEVQWTEFPGGPQLLEVRAVAAYGRAQRLVDPQREACAVRRGEHEVLAVVGKSDELELCHEVPPTFSHPYRAIREPVERGGGPVRRVTWGRMGA